MSVTLMSLGFCCDLLPGPRGAKGDQGLAGRAGASGSSGPIGRKGFKGEPSYESGHPGPAGQKVLVISPFQYFQKVVIWPEAKFSPGSNIVRPTEIKNMQTVFFLYLSLL